MRKVDQIAFNKDGVLYALCNDGTVWQLAAHFEGEEWIQVCPIPQEKPELPINESMLMDGEC